MPAINLQAAPQSQSWLLSDNLPMELKLIIFDKAFARPSDLTFITRHRWRIRELRKKNATLAGSDFVRRRFPGSKAIEFAASKEFFCMAARAYVCSQPGDNDAPYMDCMGSNNIFMMFAAAFTSSGAYFSYLAMCAPNLKTLSLEMSPFVFSNKADSCHISLIKDDSDSSEADARIAKRDNIKTWVMQTLLTEEDFATFQSMNDDFTRLGDIEFELIDKDSRRPVPTLEDISVWFKNLKAYERFMRRHIATSKDAEQIICHDIAGEGKGEPKAAPNTPLAHHSTPAYKTVAQTYASATLSSVKPSLSSHMVSGNFAATSTKAVHQWTPSLVNWTEQTDTGATNDSNANGKRARSVTEGDSTRNPDERCKIRRVCTLPSDGLAPVPSKAADGPLHQDDPSDLTSPTTTSRASSNSRFMTPSPKSSQSLVTASLTFVLEQFEQLLDSEDPTVMCFVADLKARGKL